MNADAPEEEGSSAGISKGRHNEEEERRREKNRPGGRFSSLLLIPGRRGEKVKIWEEEEVGISGKTWVATWVISRVSQ